MATHWHSKIGFIVAAAGSAIGLGNIWRFPYLLSQYGGAAFLFVYLLTVFGLGVFILMAKLAFGRAAGTDFPQSFEKTAKERGLKISKLWRWSVGYLGVFNCTLVICVYLIVVAWTLCYAVMGAVNLMADSPVPMEAETFKAFTGSFSFQFFWIVCCVLICVYIMAKSIQKGIEKVCLKLMPLFFVFLIFLSLWMVFTADMGRVGFFLTHPNWARFGITANGFDFAAFNEAMLAVFGQALYSVSLGFGVMFVYGSYMDKTTDILKSVPWIVIMDTIVACLSGFIVLTALAKESLTTNQGPELSFITIPLVFSKMHAGAVLMFAFFVLLFLAALTSIISMYEVPINTLIKGERMSRKKAVLCVGSLNLVGSVIILLSLTGVVPLTIWGKDLFVAADKITGEYTIALMMGLCCLFMGWKIFPTILSDIQKTRSRPIPKAIQWYWEKLLKWIVPSIFLGLIISAICK